MSERPLCELCGEPMPDGETMFKYHGYSGPCPKPPKRQRATEVIVEYFFREADDGGLWIDVRIDRQGYRSVGPFDTVAERQRCYDDMLQMVRSVGGKDVPNHAM